MGTRQDIGIISTTYQQNIDGNANLICPVRSTHGSTLIGIHVVEDVGTPAGTLHFQASCNYNPSTGTGDWYGVSNSAYAVGVEALTSWAYPWFRIYFITSGGSGSFSVYVWGK